MSEALLRQSTNLFDKLKLVNSSKPLSIDEQFALVNETHPEIRYQLATRSDTNEGVLRALQSDDKKIQNAIERHPLINHIIKYITSYQSDINEQERFALHWNPGVRSALVSSSQTAPTVLELLVFDSDVRVRKNLASNPRTPSKTLLQLGKDSSVSVRLKITKRNDLSEVLYDLLAKDKSNKVVRQLLLSHGNKLNEKFKISKNHSEKIENLSDPNFLDIVSLRILHEQ
ncbi:MAG: hypothetical protein HeimC3_25640 [Candidatus Heimdallarchaeota archaeon LC_3]|nr:MAG: hypothetical protein HeimC3_25640 [Candidatus Heimdallarchaeota archaeon LC_3]